MKGSEFVQQMKSVKNADLDGIMLKYLLDDANVPEFLRGASISNLVAVQGRAVIDDKLYVVTTYHKKNYLAIGENDDYLLAPLSETSLQAWCTGKQDHWYIPPKMIVKRVWDASECKILPQVISRTNSPTTSGHPGEVLATGLAPVWDEQLMINAAMARKGCPLTAFIRAKKAYITAPNVNGSLLHFTGWYTDGKDGWYEKDPNWTRAARQSPAPGPYGWAWQDSGTRPVDSAPHPANFADYSHGCDVVFYQCDVNGQAYDFADLCQHPTLNVLVSDQGPFNPHFPNTGSSAPKPNKPSPALPPASAPPSNYNGPVFKTSAGKGPVLVKASTIGQEYTALPSNGGAGPVLLGIGAAALLALAVKSAGRHPAMP